MNQTVVFRPAKWWRNPIRWWRERRERKALIRQRIMLNGELRTITEYVGDTFTIPGGDER